jgi:preprotein translocase subunit SecG
VSTVLVILHVLVCVFLIAVVLLQRGKGAEIGAVFGGGGSSTVFGSRGAGNFLTKLTTASAIIFMITSISLAYVWTKRSEDRLFQDLENVEQEAAPEAAPSEGVFEEVETVPAEPAPEAEAPAAEAPSAQAPKGSLPPLTTPPEGNATP